MEQRESKEVYNPRRARSVLTRSTAKKPTSPDKRYARYAEHTGKLASKLFELGKFDAENPDLPSKSTQFRDNFTAAKAAIKEHLQKRFWRASSRRSILDTLAKRLTIKMRKTAAENYRKDSGLGSSANPMRRGK